MAACGCGALIVWGGFVGVTQQFAAKHSWKFALVGWERLMSGAESGGLQFMRTRTVPAASIEHASTANAAVANAMGDHESYSAKETSQSSRRYGYGAATLRALETLPKASGWVLLPLAWVGWRFRPRLKSPGCQRFLGAFLVLYPLAAIQFSAIAGYMAERHWLPWITVLLGYSGLGAIVLIRSLAQGGIAWAKAGTAGPPWGITYQRADDSQPKVATRESIASGIAAGSSRFWSPRSRSISHAPGAATLLRWSLALAAAIVGVAAHWKPLHASRASYRQAGEWLATRAAPEDLILDTRLWTLFSSGRETRGYENARETLAHPRLKFVVVSQQEMLRNSPRSRTLRSELERHAQPVATFPPRNLAGNGSVPCEPVLVYRWRGGDRLAERESQELLESRESLDETRRRISAGALDADDCELPLDNDCEP